MRREEIEKILNELLPRMLSEHPETRVAVERILYEKALPREEAEARFERLLEEIKRLREDFQELKRESDRRWEELTGENARLWQEFQKLKKESDQRWEEMNRRWEELKKESDQRWEEMNRRWEELKRESDQRWEEMLKEVRRVDRRIDRTIGALGARWGLYSEHAFREALAEILSEFGGFQVSRYLAYDETGQVFGHPDQVEIDLLIKDGKVWVAELKSSVSKAEVYAFERKVRFYEEKEGQKVERRLIISPMVDPEARKVAEKLGIQIFAQPEDLEEVQVF